MVLMLQSLHHGLCLVMQSIHNLAQHWPIISMEDFMAQPEAEAQLEVTSEATPQTSPATTPFVEVSEEEEGAEDTDYATNMAAAQSTWDPWPTTA
ncbi:hypothetical protein HKD37_03G007571 [Glycine soja]